MHGQPPACVDDRQTNLQVFHEVNDRQTNWINVSHSSVCRLTPVRVEGRLDRRTGEFASVPRGLRQTDKWYKMYISHSSVCRQTPVWAEDRQIDRQTDRQTDRRIRECSTRFIDRQTNLIKYIPFVCPSTDTVAPPPPPALLPSSLGHRHASASASTQR
jgi:hypothetical protein